jgi:hypothetical protein
MKLYHIDYHGIRCRHIFASSKQEAATLMTAWLTYNKVPIHHDIWVSKVDAMLLDRKRREHQFAAEASGLKGMGNYDSEQGWEIHSIFEEPMD